MHASTNLVNAAEVEERRETGQEMNILAVFLISGAVVASFAPISSSTVLQRDQISPRFYV